MREGGPIICLVKVSVGPPPPSPLGPPLTPVGVAITIPAQVWPGHICSICPHQMPSLFRVTNVSKVMHVPGLPTLASSPHPSSPVETRGVT